MAVVHYAANVTEAIDFAQEGKRTGKWDFFRGQTNANWKVVASIYRRSDTEQEAVKQQILRFVGWANTAPMMAPYRGNDDAMLAIAQHYGIPTPLIDVTTEPRVAGFFACDMQHEPQTGQLAAIVCIDRSDLEEFIRSMWPVMTRGQVTKQPEFLQLDVVNLWRLQTQQGLFYWNPVVDFERWYDYDRIVFPYSKDDPGIPRKDEIYPVDQSPLERSLAQFFSMERVWSNQGWLDKLKADGRVHVVDATVDSYEMASWHDGTIDVDPEWKEADSWNEVPVEHAADVLPGVAIRIDPNRPVDRLLQDLERELSVRLIRSARTRTLFFPDGPPTNGYYQRIVAKIRRVWNGMRNLPYTDEEIHTALCRVLELVPRALQEVQMTVSKREDEFMVDLAIAENGRGAGTRALVTFSGMLAACTPGFVQAVEKHIHRPISDSPVALVMLHARPWERFTFSGLRRLMVEEIIPTQIAYLVDEGEYSTKETVIIFSPTEFKVFGLA